MKNMVLLGDEALALGAIHAGLSCGFGYPGTPSTEILEYLLDYKAKNPQSPIAQWCTNEKTAFESALGTSFAGKRTMVTMKHVGLNVAADAFMNAALVGIKGGLVVVVADDPGMHSSQNEQDSRFYADFAMIPCLEPVNQQEAYEMMFDAFALSEKFNVPVMVRMVTRLSHSRAGVQTKAEKDCIQQNKLSKADRLDWMLLPALARKNYEKMLAKQAGLEDWARNYSYNHLTINPAQTDFAIITSGLGKNYYLENSKDYKAFCNQQGKPEPSTLHISTLPLPIEAIKKLAQTAQTILVIEEGMPFLEKGLRGILEQKNTIIGKLSGHLPRTGELNPDHIRSALKLPTPITAFTKTVQESCTSLPSRPPQLCKGCPHVDSYTAINKTAANLIQKAGKDNVIITSDIGCYALGAVAPLNAGESIVCMGSSIGMARGAAQAGVKYAFGVIGDSTFLHSGITNVIDAVSTQTSMTAIILDNSIVAMTGCQKTMLPGSQFEPLLCGLGVAREHIRVLASTPQNIEANAKILEQEAEYRGVSVVIFVRECIEAFRIRNKKNKE